MDRRLVALLNQWSDEVEDIIDRIENLPVRVRAALWEGLRRKYGKTALDSTDPASGDIWDDPKNRFGKLAARMLSYLSGWRTRTERDILKYLWPGEYNQSRVVQDKLRTRLRKLEQRTRDNFTRLKCKWVLSRPRAGRLELTEEFNPNS